MANEKYYKQLDKVDYWIANADTKASFILAFAGVLGGFLLNEKANVQKDEFEIIALLQSSYILFILTLTSLIVTVIFSLLVLSARTHGDKQTLFFWGDVSKYSHWSYFQRAKHREDNDSLEEDLIYQIYINSKICTIKFKRYRISLRFLLISLVLFTIYKIVTIIS